MLKDCLYFVNLKMNAAAKKPWVGELLETKELSVAQSQCSLVKGMNKRLKEQEETKARVF